MSEFVKRFSLTGKTALVTGASKGIGAKLCRVLADAGPDIVAVAREPKGSPASDLITGQIIFADDGHTAV